MKKQLTASPNNLLKSFFPKIYCVWLIYYLISSQKYCNFARIFRGIRGLIKTKTTMYFAVNQASHIRESYILFLNEIVENGNEYYTELFKNILKESKKLASEEGDIFSVLSERFEIVDLLSKNEELIKSIDEEHPSQNDFLKLKKFLTNKEPVL
ncbi:MAG: hypothetical protein R6U46_06515 [Marinilabilia sp.]